MQFRTFSIDGPIEILPRKIGDERGYFSEILRMEPFLHAQARSSSCRTISR